MREDCFDARWRKSLFSRFSACNELIRRDASGFSLRCSTNTGVCVLRRSLLSLMGPRLTNDASRGGNPGDDNAGSGLCISSDMLNSSNVFRLLLLGALKS